MSEIQVTDSFKDEKPLFNLSRYFSLTAGIGVLLVIVILSFFFRYLAENSMMNNQTQANLNITHSFANSAWQKLQGFNERTLSLFSTQELLQQPEIAELHQLTRRQMKGTNVVKVKIYNLNGWTIFSTDASQIGKDKSQSIGFKQAKIGEVVSAISFRNEFNALENKILDRNLIATYIPIFDEQTQQVKAVFEVYSDVTALVDEVGSNQVYITAGVSASLLLLYLFLYVIILRAHGLLIEHDKDRKERAKKALYQAYHDTLTGLMNRNSFLERIPESMRRVKRHNASGGLLFIDLDRFKIVNDNLGHDAGDQLLCKAAECITQAIRETDQAFRISGDEFIVILDDLTKEEDAAVIAQRILTVIRQPVIIKGNELMICMSIGITTYTKDNVGQNIEELVKQADAAMYQAKKTGTNQFEFFSDSMSKRMHERFSLEADIRNAMHTNQFVPYYQAKVKSDSLAVVSAEALLRWEHPEKGIIQPSVFIPVLEETGLICEVGETLIRNVCHHAYKWLQGGRPLRVSVNVSAIQFSRKDFVEVVESALENSGLPAELLELELTESMFLDNVDFAIDIMHQLKKLGVKLSIDDFGTGYSSLSYLKKFPIDILKVDRSFVKGVLENSEDLAITQSVCTLGHALNLKLTAEGVETEQQVVELKKLGCHELQGFLFSKPLSLEKFEQFSLNHQVNG